MGTKRQRETGREAKADWGEHWQTGCVCGDWKVYETGGSDNSHCCLRLQIEFWEICPKTHSFSMKQQSHFSRKAVAALCLVLMVLIQQVLISTCIFFKNASRPLKLNELQVKFNTVVQFIHIWDFKWKLFITWCCHPSYLTRVYAYVFQVASIPVLETEAASGSVQGVQRSLRRMARMTPLWRIMGTKPHGAYCQNNYECSTGICR